MKLSDKPKHGGEEEEIQKDIRDRSISLEQAYVHDVYEKIAKDLSLAPDPFVDVVKEFFGDLEPGTIVADVGCGDGRHLSVSKSSFVVGVDRCLQQSQLSRMNIDSDVLTGDNLRLPYRDDSFDAVTSVCVIHHFATRERRVMALRELGRVLRIGGKLLIIVEATEIHPECDSQDVLIPWYEEPLPRERTESIGKGVSDQKEENADSSNDDDENDDISVVSSDGEDAHIPGRFSPPYWKKGRSQSVGGGQTIVYESELPSTSAQSCYGFLKGVIRRLSSEPLPRIPVENTPRYCRHSQVDEAGSENEKLQDVPRNDVIEIRNLDDDLEKIFGQPSCPLYRTYSDSHEHQSLKEPSSSRSQLVRTFSEFFRNIPSLWNRRTSLPVSPSYSRQPSIDMINDFHSDDTLPRMNLTRSKTTATCTSLFERYKSLDLVEESDLSDMDEEKSPKIRHQTKSYVSYACDNSSRNTVTVSDIVNGNITEFNSTNYPEDVQNIPSVLHVSHFEDSNAFTSFKSRFSKDVPNSSTRSPLPEEDSSFCETSNEVIPADSLPRCCLLSNYEVLRASGSQNAKSRVITNENFNCIDINGSLLTYSYPDSDEDDSTGVPVKEGCLIQSSDDKSDFELSCVPCELDTNQEHNVNESPKHCHRECKTLLTHELSSNDLLEELNFVSPSLNEDVEGIINQLKTLGAYECEESPKRCFNGSAKIGSSKTIGPFCEYDGAFEDESTICSYYSMPELYRLTEYYQTYIKPKRRKISMDTSDRALGFASTTGHHLPCGTSSVCYDMCANAELSPRRLKREFSNISKLDAMEEEETFVKKIKSVASSTNSVSLDDRCKNLKPQNPEINKELKDKSDTLSIRPKEKETSPRFEKLKESSGIDLFVVGDKTSLNSEDELNPSHVDAAASLMPADTKNSMFQNPHETICCETCRKYIFSEDEVGTDTENDNRIDNLVINVQELKQSLKRSRRFSKPTESSCLGNDDCCKQRYSLPLCFVDISNRVDEDKVSRFRPNIVSDSDKQTDVDIAVSAFSSSKDSQKFSRLYRSTNVQNLSCLDSITESEKTKGNLKLFMANCSQKSLNSRENTLQDDCLKEHSALVACGKHVGRGTKSSNCSDVRSIVPQLVGQKNSTFLVDADIFENYTSRDSSNTQSSVPNSAKKSLAQSAEHFTRSVDQFTKREAEFSEKFNSHEYLHDISANNGKDDFPNESENNVQIRMVSSDSSQMSPSEVAKDSISRPGDSTHSPSPRQNTHTYSDKTVDYLQGYVSTGGAIASMHRYFHTFREQELERLIDQYVDDLHVLKSFQHQHGWCIVAEKVQVWKI